LRDEMALFWVHWVWQWLQSNRGMQEWQWYPLEKSSSFVGGALFGLCPP
jgi:hypothetical protein